MKNKKLLSVFLGLLAKTSPSIAQQSNLAGASEKTQYFGWINNTNEGPTEKQTQINFDFFKWLKRDYGMQLDIYAFDAGAIVTVPENFPDFQD